MKFEFFGKVNRMQDGAMYGDYLFSLNAKGECRVYKIKDVEGKSEDAEPISFFMLHKSDLIIPHSNAVTFSKSFYKEGDEFPLLYTNIYNNYSKSENKLKGVCLVYRILRNGNDFSTELVQMIEVGFTEDAVWKSESEDVRPYGNFVVDSENDILYAYVMRDSDEVTRYFAFKLPSVSDGAEAKEYGIKKAVLGKEDIIKYFDCPYHRYIQGGCVEKGIIYSCEGFTDNEKNPPAIRIINPSEEKQICYIKCGDYVTNNEAEMVTFSEGECYYGDCCGNVYKVTF